jgi:anaerobic magnesium-protoporphyrin IX monomethyl ester cyclase
MLDALVIAPFRRPTFRKAISNTYPTQEPWDSPPLLVAGALEEVGLNVDYLALQNLFDSWDESRDLSSLIAMLQATPARMVIFSSDYFIPSRSTATIFGIRIIAREVRRLSPSTVVGVVGRLATTAGARLLESVIECDFVVHGEPESVIGDIAVSMLDDPAGAQHPSLVLRDRPTLLLAPVAATTDTLDELALPAWHLLRRSLALWSSRPGGGGGDDLPFSLRTSAGCKFRCRFCAGVPNWLSYRKKSADRVAAEIDALVAATDGRAHFSFLEDEIFTRDADHVRAVSKVCQERDMRFDGLYTHSSLLTNEVVEPLSRMVNRVFLGLDNPDDAILREMRKGQDFGTVLGAIATARSVGLGVHLEWIVGTPPETVDTLITSLNSIATLYGTGVVESINTYVYCPHPGTEYAEHGENYELTILDDFDDMQESGGFPSYETANLSRDQIFVAYLMSQLTIAEIGHARRSGVLLDRVGTPSRDELRRLFDKLARVAV